MICKNDEHSTIVEANDAAYKILGFSREEMYHTHHNRFANLLVDNLEKMLEKVKTSTFGDNNILDYEYRIRNNNGEIVWIHDIARYEKEENLFYVAIMDITYKAKELEEKSLLVSTDPLTGLLNHYGIENKVSLLLENISAPRAMFLIQLVNLDLINEEYRIVDGDIVLVQAAEKLKGIVSGNMLLGRSGGDEFLLQVPECPTFSCLSDIISKILSTLMFQYKQITLSCNIGVAWDEKIRYDFKTLYIMADESLSQAKNHPNAHYYITR